MVEALLQMCDRDVVDNHKSCSEYFWLMNRYAIMVTAKRNWFLFFSLTRSSFCTSNPCTFCTIRYYIHTEIYTLKSRRVIFRSQTDVNQSNVAYRFSHIVRKAIRPIRSRVSFFFHVWAVRQVEVFIQGWLARFRTPHKSSLCESEESKYFLFAFLPSLILKVPVSVKAMSEKRFVIHDSLK